MVLYLPTIERFSWFLAVYINHFVDFVEQPPPHPFRFFSFFPTKSVKEKEKCFRFPPRRGDVNARLQTYTHMYVRRVTRLRNGEKKKNTKNERLELLFKYHSYDATYDFNASDSGVYKVNGPYKYCIDANITQHALAVLRSTTHSVRE